MKLLLSAVSSVGIIGGADGPTAIFVTASPDWGMYAGGVVFAVLAVALIVVKRRKK